MEPPFLYPDIEETFPFQIELPQTFPGRSSQLSLKKFIFNFQAQIDF